MNRIVKFAMLGMVAVALPVAWRAGVFESEQQKEAKALEALAKEYGIERYYVKAGFFRDQVELSPEFVEVAPEIKKLANEEMERSGVRGLGAFKEHNQIIKRLLKERHGIEWRPLEEMNPFVEFD